MSRCVQFVAAISMMVSCIPKPYAQVEPTPESTTAQMAELISAQKILLRRMNTPNGSGKLRTLDDAVMGPLLSEGWKLAGQWAGAWFDLHPKPSADNLLNLFVSFTPPPADPQVYDPNFPGAYAMEGSASKIDTDTYVVRAVYEESQSAIATSTFFVVGRDANGHFLPKWSVKPLAQQHYRSKDEIGLWAFLGSCAYYCGSLVVQEVLPLPPTSSGQSRFAVDAFQATNGSTLVKQLSVWQWNGFVAKNLVIKSYNLYIDEDRDIDVVGNFVSIPTKESTDSFSSLGCCAEPRGVWILRIEPDRIQDLGHHFLQPQIQWADRLLTESRAKSPHAASLASPSVVAFLRKTDFDGIMIDRCNVLSSGKKGEFEISFAEGVKLRLAYRLRTGQPYFTDIRFE